MPLRVDFERMTDAQHRFLVEGAPDDLQPDGKAGGAETTRVRVAETLNQDLRACQADSLRTPFSAIRVVLLNYWAAWCVPCRTEMPSIEALYRCAIG